MTTTTDTPTKFPPKVKSPHPIPVTPAPIDPSYPRLPRVSRRDQHTATHPLPTRKSRPHRNHPNDGRRNPHSPNPSNARAARSSSASELRFAISCRPTGIPASANPHGSEIAGSPAIFAGIV